MNVRRSNTDVAAERSALLPQLAFQHLHQLHGVTRLGHLLHHLLSLFELVQQLVHVCRSGAAALGDTPAAAPI